jgi:putative endonuclease
MFYVYILRSQTTGKFYIGQTENLERRLHYHNSGYSKSTKSGVPWELVYNEEFEDRTSAMKREVELKRKKSKIYIKGLIDRRASR